MDKRMMMAWLQGQAQKQELTTTRMQQKRLGVMESFENMDAKTQFLLNRKREEAVNRLRFQDPAALPPAEAATRALVNTARSGRWEVSREVDPTGPVFRTYTTRPQGPTKESRRATMVITGGSGPRPPANVGFYPPPFSNENGPNTYNIPLMNPAAASRGIQEALITDKGGLSFPPKVPTGRTPWKPGKKAAVPLMAVDAGMQLSPLVTAGANMMRTGPGGRPELPSEKLDKTGTPMMAVDAGMQLSPLVTGRTPWKPGKKSDQPTPLNPRRNPEMDRISPRERKPTNREYEIADRGMYMQNGMNEGVYEGDWVRDPRNPANAVEVYTPQQHARIQNLADTLAEFDRANLGKSLSGEQELYRSRLIDMLGAKGVEVYGGGVERVSIGASTPDIAVLKRSFESPLQGTVNTETERANADVRQRQASIASRDLRRAIEQQVKSTAEANRIKQANTFEFNGPRPTRVRPPIPPIQPTSLGGKLAKTLIPSILLGYGAYKALTSSEDNNPKIYEPQGYIPPVPDILPVKPIDIR